MSISPWPTSSGQDDIVRVKETKFINSSQTPKNVLVITSDGFGNSQTYGWTVQKCSQCARSSEKWQFLWRAMEEDRLPDRIAEQTEGENAFQRERGDQLKQRIESETES